MRIGIDASLLMTDQMTGVEIYLSELTARMPQIGRDHDFLLYFNFFQKKSQITFKRFAHEGFRIRVCRIPPQMMSLLHLQFGLPIDWITGRVDIMFYPSSLAFPQKKGKTVITVHDLIPLTHPEFCDPQYVRFIQERIPSSIHRADAIIVVSDYTQKMLQEMFKVKPETVYCIPNGVNERFYLPSKLETTASIVAHYGIQRPFLLFVGAIEPRKNLVRLVRAFSRANQSSAVREHTLVLIGKPSWDWEALRAEIAKLDSNVRVMLPGYIPPENLPALYRGATAFLFPSLQEGFGIPVLEAMASGCPVLTSSISPLKEIVRDAALTVDPFDTEAITDGICTIVENSKMRERLRTNGRTRAEEFSWDRTAKETLKVLETVQRTAIKTFISKS